MAPERGTQETRRQMDPGGARTEKTQDLDGWEKRQKMEGLGGAFNSFTHTADNNPACTHIHNILTQTHHNIKPYIHTYIHTH